MSPAATVRLETKAGRPVLFFSGEITGEIETELATAWDELKEAIATNKANKADELNTSKTILLDFSRADYINSSGIALLLDLAMTKEGEEKPEIALVGLSRQLRKVLELVGLLEFVETYPHLEEALASVS